MKFLTDRLWEASSSPTGEKRRKSKIKKVFKKKKRKLKTRGKLESQKLKLVMAKVIIHSLSHSEARLWGCTLRQFFNSSQLMGQEEEIIEMHPQAIPVHKVTQTKDWVSRVTWETMEFPSVWKHAKLRTQEDSLEEALNKHGGSVWCGSSHWVFLEDFKEAACLRQCVFSYHTNSDLEMKQKVNSNHVPVTTMATNSTSVKVGCSCLAKKPSGSRDGPTSEPW